MKNSFTGHEVDLDFYVKNINLVFICNLKFRL